MDKHVLVTGGAGYIGSHACKVLSEAGFVPVAFDNLSRLPKDDRGHLAIDFKRVYSRLIPEWLHYMEYLQTQYPFLFHLAMRKNPFDLSASVVIGKE